MPDTLKLVPTVPALIGIATDHGGFESKNFLVARLREVGQEVLDFGERQPRPDDDYPDFVVPLARAVAGGEVARGIAICGSGVGASVAANKVAGIRACLIHETFSAHPAARPAADYTARVSPCCDEVSVPLEYARILWQH